MNARTISLGFAFAALAACAKDKAPSTDSSLARDLALAGSQTPQPATFQDTAVAPAPTQAGRAKEEPPAPVRARVAQQPINQTPRPLTPTVSSQPAPATVLQAPAATPAPAPAPAAAEIGAGAGFALTSGSKICSTSLPGEKFVATVNSPVTGSNGAVIPAGATVVLEVATARQGENADNAQMTFRVRAIVVGDKTYNVAADVAPEASLVKSKVQGADPNADKKKVVGGAIAGAILGQMIGHNTKGTVFGAAAGAAAGAAVAKSNEKWEACLPAGSPLKLTLSAPLIIS
jgi:hypothetical protein